MMAFCMSSPLYFWSNRMEHPCLVIGHWQVTLAVDSLNLVHQFKVDVNITQTWYDIVKVRSKSVRETIFGDKLRAYDSRCLKNMSVK